MEPYGELVSLKESLFQDFPDIILVPTTFIKQEPDVEAQEVVVGLEEAPTFLCKECNMDFVTKSFLKKHIKHFHLRKARRRRHGTLIPVPEDQIHRCPSCEYSSSRRDKLDRHMERHVLLDGVHPCGRRRHRPEQLPRRHRHNAEEYRCALCPYACTVAKAMRKHLRVHAEGRPTLIKLSCKVCGKDRAGEAELARHMRRHRAGDRLLCDVCDFSSVQLKKVIQHRRMHTGEKPHLCPHCRYRSARRDNLRSHVRRVHRRENMYIDTFSPGSEPDALQ